MAAGTEQLWEQFRIPLRHFIRRRVSDDLAADDILQDVFLRLHGKLDTLRQRERVASWLYQVTRNAITDYYRSRRPADVLPDELPLAEEEGSDEPVESLLPCVRAMVEALPAPYRDALRLTEYDGLSQKAMGEQLGLSLSGAKSRVQRGRALIKEKLLACCHFELDHAGRIISYQPHCECCSRGGCQSVC